MTDVIEVKAIEFEITDDHKVDFEKGYKYSVLWSPILKKYVRPKNGAIIHLRSDQYEIVEGESKVPAKQANNGQD